MMIIITMVMIIMFLQDTEVQVGNIFLFYELSLHSEV